MHLETLAIQSTHFPDENAAAVSTPIYLSTTFERGEDGSYPKNYVYSRVNNPNRQLLENSMATLEGGTHGFAFASGLAGITAALQILQAGDHVILGDDAYFAAGVLMTEVFGPWGLTISRVDMTDLSAVRSAFQANTKLLWLETPSNPLLKITDIAALAEIAHQHGALCAVDNTWATSVLQRPLELGADIVHYSTTKYFGGHSDVLGGALIVKDAQLAERLKKVQSLGGAVPSPFECWLTTRGIKTMPLRVKAQSESAFTLARFLSAHPKVEQVHYPGLETHAGHEIAKRQMKSGFGGMLSFQVKGGSAEALKVANHTRLFIQATSLGGVESLIEHRRSVEGAASTSPENLLRVSVGLEHPDDLIEDLKQALEA
ncbi:aminotransferase class V-fold PLP-dependent enzyme [Cytophagaceae bacterium DM2B3-1]|uniref:Aminotransferase class V-fold PLP-dependent enzyme n=1 Tax=Xanthocytophaga flava TaxID=3048013 RepID=A0ABT7CVD6_9BACT|nr:aminotransferase class V-fold PLP-dependent enzyme [Xanthocytophaga flavus]MDJ1497733.1 aminotransferase class V-fold PLP-dependent enzyme [Xanthocytophaga flavus]